MTLKGHDDSFWQLNVDLAQLVMHWPEDLEILVSNPIGGNFWRIFFFALPCVKVCQIIWQKRLSWKTQVIIDFVIISGVKYEIFCFLSWITKEEFVFREFNLPFWLLFSALIRLFYPTVLIWFEKLEVKCLWLQGHQHTTNCSQIHSNFCHNGTQTARFEMFNGFTLKRKFNSLSLISSFNRKRLLFIKELFWFELIEML